MSAFDKDTEEQLIVKTRMAVHDLNVLLEEFARREIEVMVFVLPKHDKLPSALQIGLKKVIA